MIECDVTHNESTIRIKIEIPKNYPQGEPLRIFSVKDIKSSLFKTREEKIIKQCNEFTATICEEAIFSLIQVII
jgi:hypothetical protein